MPDGWPDELDLYLHNGRTFLNYAFGAHVKKTPVMHLRKILREQREYLKKYEIFLAKTHNLRWKKGLARICSNYRESVRTLECHLPHSASHIHKANNTPFKFGLIFGEQATLERLQRSEEKHRQYLQEVASATDLPENLKEKLISPLIGRASERVQCLEILKY